MIRFLFLRFLPRRLLPLLTLVEVLLVVRRIWTGTRPARRRARTASGPTTPRTITEMTPPEVDGQLYGG